MHKNGKDWIPFVLQYITCYGWSSYELQLIWVELQLRASRTSFYRHCTNTDQLLEEIDFCRIIFSLKLLFRFLHMGHLLFFTPYVPVTIWKPIWQERRKHRKEIKFELITMRGKNDVHVQLLKCE